MAYLSQPLVSGRVALSGPSQWVPIPGVSLLAVGLRLTAGDGTPDLSIRLRGTDDPSTDSLGYVIPLDQVVHEDGTVTTDEGWILLHKITLDDVRISAVVRHCAWKYISAEAVQTGTGSFSVSLSVSGK